MSELPEPIRPSEMRASDADREHVAGLLRQAAAEGRLDLNELDDRLSQAYTARTYRELEPLTKDLPLAGSVQPQPPAVHRPEDSSLPASSGAVAILGGFKRTGRWRPAEIFAAFAYWGGGEIDLREASLTGGTVKIRAVAIMGGIEIIAPEDATVQVTGIGIMGGFDHDANHVGPPGAPTIIVQGVAFWGGVSVSRKPSNEEMKRRKLERKRLKEERRGISDQ